MSQPATADAELPDTLPPAEPPPPYERAGAVLGLTSMAELRRVTGLRADELAARMGCSLAHVTEIESLDLELLEVIALIGYVEGLGMRLSLQVDIHPEAPLTILSTRR